MENSDIILSSEYKELTGIVTATSEISLTEENDVQKII